jgi:hypothetical protein
MVASIKPEENHPSEPERSRRIYQVTGSEMERIGQMGTLARLSDATEYSVKIFKAIAADNYRDRMREEM